MALETLGEYRVLKLLAQGGMGEVWLACREGPEGFHKEVVIKRMLKHLAKDQFYENLFLNEAKVSMVLQHPNIVHTLELNRAEDSWFLVMEHVRGRSLRSCIRHAKKTGRQIPEAIAVWLIAEALQGLHFVHNLTDSRGYFLGILHRDISPDNLLLSWDGAVKLADFGVSKAIGNMNLPTGGGRNGKISYMAPEYFNGGNTDVRSDIYSMGVCLHELLTLELPDCVPQNAESAYKPRAPYAPRENLCKELNDILFKALSPNSAERWNSAAEMARALIQSLAAKKQSGHASRVSVWMRDFWDLETVDVDPFTDTPSSQIGSGQVGGTKPVTDAQKLAQQALLELQPAPVESAPPPSTAPKNLLRVLSMAASLVAVGLLYWVAASAPLPKEVPPPEPVLPPAVPSTKMALLPSLRAGLPPLQGGVVAEDTEEASMLVAQKGFVRITAPPNTLVSYQGKRLGKTPMKPVALPAGLVQLQVRNKRLGISKSYPVDIEAGKEVVLRIRRPKAKAPSP